MKKIFTATAVIALLGIVACGQPASENTMSSQVSEKVSPYKGRFETDPSPLNINYVLTDTRTNCKYIAVNEGVTPLLKSDGLPDCDIPNTISE